MTELHRHKCPVAFDLGALESLLALPPVECERKPAGLGRVGPILDEFLYLRLQQEPSKPGIRIIGVIAVPIQADTSRSEISISCAGDG
jgi:hypothetical protein